MAGGSVATRSVAVGEGGASVILRAAAAVLKKAACVGRLSVASPSSRGVGKAAHAHREEAKSTLQQVKPSRDDQLQHLPLDAAGPPDTEPACGRSIPGWQVQSPLTDCLSSCKLNKANSSNFVLV